MLTKANVRRIAVVTIVVAALWGPTLGEGVYAHESEGSAVGSGAGQVALQQQAGPVLSIGDASVREDDEEATLIVSLESVADHDVSVEYTTVNGSAVSPDDYTSASGLATIPAGSTSTSIVLLIIDDDEKERKSSLSSAVVHFEHQGKRINLIDAPGYPDFIGQAIGALRAVETAVIELRQSDPERALALVND